VALLATGVGITEQFSPNVQAYSRAARMNERSATQRRDPAAADVPVAKHLFGFCRNNTRDGRYW